MIFIYKKITKKDIKNIISLKKSKTRKKKNQFIIEGFSLIKNILINNFTIHTLYTYHKKYIHKLSYLDDINKEIIVFILKKNTFKKISYNISQNNKIIAVINTKEQKSLNNKIKIKQNKLILILNNIEKPGNIGAIIRTAQAGYVDLIILNNIKTDLFNPNIIRSSIGTIFYSKIIINNNTNEIFNWLKYNSIKILLTTTKSNNNIYDINLHKSTIAIVMGSEDKGIDAQWINICNNTIKIPMNNVHSLNVSVASAIIIFEHMRQINKHFNVF